MKELTKEEILSKRIGTYGFTKLELSKPIICPIEALDAMQEYSDQNTKPLIDEIAELRKEVEYQKSGYVTLKEYLKTDDILGAIAKLKSELKASKSEANEVVEFAEWCGNKYVKLHSAWVSRCVYKTDSKLYHTTTELYEIFKTLNNKQNEKI